MSFLQQKSCLRPTEAVLTLFDWFMGILTPRANGVRVVDILSKCSVLQGFRIGGSLGETFPAQDRTSEGICLTLWGRLVQHPQDAFLFFRKSACNHKLPQLCLLCESWTSHSFWIYFASMASQYRGDEKTLYLLALCSWWKRDM